MVVVWVRLDAPMALKVEVRVGLVEAAAEVEALGLETGVLASLLTAEANTGRQTRADTTTSRAVTTSTRHDNIHPCIHASMDPWIHGSMDPCIHPFRHLLQQLWVSSSARSRRLGLGIGVEVV